jgi:tetratricopeptide (TPR) repeat protein
MNKSFIPSFLALLIALLALQDSFSQGITVPRTPSPAATFTQTLGISTITVKYSRPKVNNREVWGKLVPYGWNVQAFGLKNSAPWRAGANENTTIELSHAARIEGQDVPAGTYGLFFVINADNSGEVILSKESRSWGSFFYNPANDQLRAKIQLRDVPHTELLTYDMVNLTKTNGELVLNWEKKQFPVKVEFDVDKIVMANAEEELKGPLGFNFQGPASAANYALANKVNADRALVWIDQAIAQQKNFNTMRIKSGLLRLTGKTADADKLMADAMAGATENEVNLYGYQLLNQGDVDKAIEVLAMNAQKNPKSANCWDSLGEAYARKGDKDNAVKNFRKALSLNPPENVKANSEAFLKRFGAM